MQWQDYIEQRPEVMMGKPTFKRTRITVEHVLERLGDGNSESDLLAAHPRLRPEHICAAQAYAAPSLSTDDTVFLAYRT